MWTIGIYVLIGFAILFLFAFIHILKEYERAVIFTLGRFWKVKGPGLILLVPIIQQMFRVQLRELLMVLAKVIGQALMK